MWVQIPSTPPNKGNDMLWFLEIKFWFVKHYYRLTGRTHILDRLKKDPYIYEE